MLTIPDQTIKENETLALDLSAYGIDEDKDLLVYRLIEGVGGIRENLYRYFADYDSSGVYRVVIGASDSQDETESSFSITVENVDRTPELKIMEPSQGVTVSKKTLLVWNFVDPDGERLSYELFFGEANELVRRSLSGTSYNPGILEPNKTYEWKLKITDESGHSYETPVYEFKTIDLPPELKKAYPIEEAKVVSVDTQLSWEITDPENDTYRFDLYLGKAGKLALYKEAIENNHVSLQGLSEGTTYEWQIIAKNNFGTTVYKSPVYRFNTNTSPEPVKTMHVAFQENIVSPQLNWEVPKDLDKDALRYDIYIGTHPDHLKLYKRNLTTNTFTPDGLCGNTQYYWLVVTKDSQEGISKSPISDFITVDGPGAVEWVYTTKYDIRSSPAIAEDGTIYVASDDDYLYAIGKDGSQKWRYRVGNAVYSSPAIDKLGNIYLAVGFRDLYSIDKDGKLRWRFAFDSSVYSSPAINSMGTVYIGASDGVLYAFDTDGNVKWRYQTLSEIRSSPSVGQDGSVYFGSDDTFFYALSSKGTLKWSFKTDGMIRSSPAIDLNGNVFFGSFDSYFYALSSEGKLLWKFKAQDEIRSSPSIFEDGSIVFGSFDGTVYKLDLSGTLLWSRKIEGAIWSSSPAVGDDGTVYIGTWDKNIYALSEEGTVKWLFETGSYIRSSPALSSDGILYIGTYDSKLLAIKTGSNGLAQYSPWPMFRKDEKHSGSLE
jgi:outer membrane protein assembly factor BamB